MAGFGVSADGEETTLQPGIQCSAVALDHECSACQLHSAIYVTMVIGERMKLEGRYVEFLGILNHFVSSLQSESFGDIDRFLAKFDGLSHDSRIQ